MKTIKIKIFTLLLSIVACAASGQNISTIAGTGTAGFSGDAGAATSANLNGPQDIALDTFGNIYIADAANHRIRKITAATGVVNTIAGTGTAGYSGDGAAATSATFFSPIGIAVDPSGNVFVADVGNHCIRRIDAVTGKISTVAGTGLSGSSGDGGSASSARLYSPYDIALDASGNLYIADVSNHKIRKVTASTGIISTVAGTGTPGFSGDGSAATSAKLYQPFCVVVDASGNLLFTDASNNRIRKITTATGIITTIAGTGTAGYSGDGSAATAAQFNTPYSIALDNSGNIYVSDFNNNRIRKINVSTATNIISTVVGTGTFGFSGDGGLATSAKIANAKGIFIDKANNIYVADEQNHRIRFVCNAATIPAAPLVSSPLTLCTGSVPGPLTAIGSSLKWYTSASGGTGSTTAPTPPVSSIGSTTYYVSQSSACGESPRAAIVVNVVAAPTTPTVTSPVVYCSGVTAAALTARGTSLLWYTSATGGSASTVAPIPSTSSAGTTTYYVSQGVSGCESSRVPIAVSVNPTPTPPVVSDIRYCLLATPSPLTATGTNLKWYTTASGGTASSVAPTPSTAVDGNVIYYVSQTNSFACESPRASINVSTNTKPKVNITAATAPKFYVCKGSKLTLKTIVAPYGINYQWQLALVNIAGASTDSFDATDAGAYRVIVSNAPNCNDTASVLVSIDSSFTSTAINPTDVNICEGVNIKLFSTSSLGAGYKYQWLKDGLLLSDTNSSIVANSKGIYELKVTNPLGCSVVSNTSTVNTFAAILKPKISQIGSTLSVSASYSTYQWYRNNKIISGATRSFYSLSFDGNYFVEVGDKNGCKNESDTLSIQNLSINELATEKAYSIYPNPTTDYVFIATKRTLEVQLIDLLGKSITQQKTNRKIDLSQLANGVYLLQIRDESGNVLGTEKITKIAGQ